MRTVAYMLIILSIVFIFILYMIRISINNPENLIKEGAGNSVGISLMADIPLGKVILLHRNNMWAAMIVDNDKDDSFKVKYTVWYRYDGVSTLGTDNEHEYEETGSSGSYIKFGKETIIISVSPRGECKFLWEDTGKNPHTDNTLWLAFTEKDVVDLIDGASDEYNYKYGPLSIMSNGVDLPPKN